MPETNRIYPTVLSKQKSAAKDTRLSSGAGPHRNSLIYGRKCQTIMFNHYSLHARKDIWGEGGNGFRLERWQVKKCKDWTYTPFSGGSRKCVQNKFLLVLMHQPTTQLGKVDNDTYFQSNLPLMRSGMLPPSWCRGLDRVENLNTNPTVWNKLAIVSSPGNDLGLNSVRH